MRGRRRFLTRGIHRPRHRRGHRRTIARISNSRRNWRCRRGVRHRGRIGNRMCQAGHRPQSLTCARCAYEPGVLDSFALWFRAHSSPTKLNRTAPSSPRFAKRPSQEAIRFSKNPSSAVVNRCKTSTVGRCHLAKAGGFCCRGFTRWT